MIRLALIALLASAGPVGAQYGPTVEFALADGWVNLRLHAGDTPVTDAKMVVLVGEVVWAEGETDAQGKGTFPQPTAATCQVVFVYSTGTSAPVPLTFTGDTLTPLSSRVGGVRPACCPLGFGADVQPAPAPAEDPSLARSRLWVFAVVLLVGGAVAVVAYRMTMSRIAPPTGENP